MNKIEEFKETMTDIAPETDKEARKSQPWIPIGGSIIAGALLFSALTLLLSFLF